jgi:hypothetical protein
VHDTDTGNTVDVRAGECYTAPSAVAAPVACSTAAKRPR